MERKIQTESDGLATIVRSLIGVAFWILSGVMPMHAQKISIALKPDIKAELQVDSADWSDAWIELSGRAPGEARLTKEDITVNEGKTRARILAVDSIRLSIRSRLAVSFALDNSSSMFHAYDSLTRICDTLLDSLPKGAIGQAVTFDDQNRSESHVYTKRSSVFIAQSGFRDSLASLREFWHFFDTVRTRYTPLYDAVASVISNIESRRLLGDSLRNDVVIVVTDGEDNASRVDIELLNDLVRTAHVRLFTINFRTGSDARLVWLARHSDGDYYYAGTIGDLRDILHDIGRSITVGYHIRYLFPSTGPIGSGPR